MPPPANMKNPRAMRKVPGFNAAKVQRIKNPSLKKAFKRVMGRMRRIPAQQKLH